MSSVHKRATTSPVIRYDFLHVVKDQYFYKLHAYHSMFTTMIMLQIIAIIFTFFGQSTGGGTNNVSVQLITFSANIIISFTAIWVFMMAITLTNKASKNMVATLVTNKQTNHLSNILFIITLSIIGGITSFLSGFFVKTVVYMLHHADKQFYIESMTIKELFIGIVATISYVLLAFAIGYVIGEIIQLHNSFIFLVPIFIIGLLVIFVNSVHTIITFYTFEMNIFIFLWKIIFTVAILFLIASIVGSRLEVRR